MPPTVRPEQHPPLDELLAWCEGDLNATRAAAVSAHVRTCDVCRTQIEDAQYVDQLLRSTNERDIEPDDPGLARARALVYERMPVRSAHARTRRNMARIAPAMVLAAILLASAVIFVDRGEQSSAGLGINAVIRLIPRSNPVVRSDDAGPPGTPVPFIVGTTVPGVTYAADLIAPETLPLNLELTGVAATSSNSASVSYASDDGLVLEVIQEIIDTPLDILTQGGTEVLVHNTPVFLMFDVPDQVSAAFWTSGEVTFAVMVLDTPSAGISGAQITEVIAAILSTDPIPDRDP